MNGTTRLPSKIVSRGFNDDVFVDFSCTYTRTYTVMALVTSAIVCVTTLFGNTLIIVSIVRFRRYFKASLYVMIANLAASDLVLGLAMILMFVELIVTEIQGNLKFCMAASTMKLVSYSTSILSLLLITADRFMAVVFPLKHMLKTNQKKFFCGLMAATWIIPGTAIIAIAVQTTSGITHEFVVCRIGAIMPFAADVASILFMITVIVICTVLYCIILWTVKERPMRALTERLYKKSVKKTSLMLVVSALFLLCWVPFIISSIIVFVSRSLLQSASCAREYVVFLGFLNSSVNWIVYGASNRKFRTAFKQIIMCAFGRIGRRNNTLQLQSSSENADQSVKGSTSTRQQIIMQPVTLN
ncbi:hypothetical protein DPMN_168080 [Dreissena polymorpha]|uniref:G-protein coupled receptors family 1 profile domain-containing protein n=1 Tax=Dreissena polymorpha TaxID=45954 RepID=A0A9D4IVL1_DREPO|nr:hypothetical protein DPMN_168080 [Dreissena polymorpha]